jgi:hypothetical protein
VSARGGVVCGQCSLLTCCTCLVVAGLGNPIVGGCDWAAVAARVKAKMSQDTGKGSQLCWYQRVSCCTSRNHGVLVRGSVVQHFWGSLQALLFVGCVL